MNVAVMSLRAGHQAVKSGRQGRRRHRQSRAGRPEATAGRVPAASLLKIPSGGRVSVLVSLSWVSVPSGRLMVMMTRGTSWAGSQLEPPKRSGGMPRLWQ
jgi:hypothetical protein